MKSRLSVFLLLALMPILSGCGLSTTQNKIAGLQIFSEPKAEVFLNDEKKGTTPYSSQTMAAGDYDVRIATGSAVWVGRTKLTAGTIVVINRQLVLKDNEGPSGETLALEKGEGIVVVSDPDSSEVQIDDRIIGKTPVSIKDVPAGDHKITVSQENYLSRSVSLQVYQGYRTVVNIELSKKQTNIATGSAQLQKQATITQTPTGWLRVRDIPSLSGIEIAKVYTDEQYPLIEEQTDWLKIKLKDSREGWISAQYAIK